METLELMRIRVSNVPRVLLEAESWHFSGISKNFKLLNLRIFNGLSFFNEPRHYAKDGHLAGGYLRLQKVPAGV
jgi:hypothetical protein